MFCFGLMGSKYKASLGLIASAAFVWVPSAEVTQRIFEMYKQPFVVTYLGISLMVVYLPIAFIKDWFCSLFPANLYKNLYNGRSSMGLDIPLTINDVHNNALETDMRSSLLTNENLSEREEGWPLVVNNEEDEHQLLEQNSKLCSWEIAKCRLYLAPLWFITEYLSNSDLANTSVASTTVLISTSGLFSLFFGALLGQDSINIGKIVAVFISMAGVAMTTVGKTWAPDEMLSVSE